MLFKSWLASIIGCFERHLFFTKNRTLCWVSSLRRILSNNNCIDADVGFVTVQTSFRSLLFVPSSSCVVNDLDGGFVFVETRFKNLLFVSLSSCILNLAPELSLHSMINNKHLLEYCLNGQLAVQCHLLPKSKQISVRSRISFWNYYQVYHIRPILQEIWVMGYSEPRQTFKMESFAKIVNDLKVSMTGFWIRFWEAQILWNLFHKISM